MSNTGKNSVDILRQEILADAGRQAERILRKARQEAEDIGAAAEKTVAAERVKAIGEAEKEAARRTSLIIARVPVEVSRIRANSAEKVLDSVRDSVRSRLAAEAMTSSRLLSLVSEAVGLVAADCVVSLSKSDKALLDQTPDWTRTVSKDCGHAVVVADEPLPEGSMGPRVVAKDGSCLCDNRLDARLNRMWPALRCGIAEKLGLFKAEQEQAAAVVAEPVAATASGGPVVVKVSGPIVTARGMEAAQMFEVVKVGENGLIGEVVRLDGDKATIQVYEDTTLLHPGAPIVLTGAPLSVCLGPGLIGNIYDGIQRPLPAIQAHFGAWIGRGGEFSAIDLDRKWPFTPSASLKPGDAVSGGMIIGTVQETDLFTHSILVPP
ncbi:MAG: hypothetical protein IJK04_09845, partial [Kiritimatiellae bacterium]|nr:hypothetical protein [Kiritimatiellia bacterium]